MLTEQEYEMIKMELLGIIKKRSSRMEAIEAAKALAELEKAHNFSLIVDDNGSLDVKVYRY